MPHRLIIFLFLCTLAWPDAGKLQAQETPCATTTVIGNPLVFGGDGGPFEQATFQGPSRMVVDSLGRLYIADSANNRVRRIELDGTIRTVVGNGGTEFPDGVSLADQASFWFPQELAIDSQDRLFVTNGSAGRVWRVDLDGIIRVFAGNGEAESSGDGNLALQAAIGPGEITVASDGALFLVDESARSLRRVGGDGVIQTVAGGPIGGISPSRGDRLAAGPDGSVYFSAGESVFQWLPDGSVELVVGGGRSLLPADGESIDPLRVFLGRPARWLVWEPSQGLFFGVFGGSVYQLQDGLLRRYFGGVGNDATFWQGRLVYTAGPRLWGIAADGTSELLAGFTNLSQPLNAVGTTVPASTITGMAAGLDGTLYMATGAGGTVNALTTDGVLRRFAGTQALPDRKTPDGAPALSAALRFPWDVAIDVSGNVLIAEFLSNDIRAVRPDGLLETTVYMGNLGGPSLLATSSDGSLVAAYTVGAGGPSEIWARPAGSADVGLLAAAQDRLAGGWVRPARDLAILPDGDVLLTGISGGVFQAFPDRPAVQWPELLRRAEHLSVGPSGELYLTDGFDGVWRRNPDGRYRLLTKLGVRPRISPPIPVWP